MKFTYTSASSSPTKSFTCLCWHLIAMWSQPVSGCKLNVTVSCTRVNLNSFSQLMGSWWFKFKLAFYYSRIPD